MPEVYLCPCCSEFSKLSERDRLLRLVQAEKEAERRKILQLDVFDERAKPLPFVGGPRPPQWVPEDDEAIHIHPNVPPPPTFDELQRRQNRGDDMRLVVTVHHGKNLAASSHDPMSVVVRCGGFEGQTVKIPLKKGTLTTWDELFEFPCQNTNEPLEMLVLNDHMSGDHVLGGILIPNELVSDATCGDETILPIEPRRNTSVLMPLWDGVSREGTMGSMVVSWYVSKNGQDRIDETAIEQQKLDEPIRCSFVTHHIFQYTDTGSEPFSGGVLCVLRDTDDNCSESMLYNLGSDHETSFSPYFSKEGYHYLPENAFKATQLISNKKLGHILICVPKEEGNSANEEEELLVIGAVPLDFGRLHQRGNAVLLIESKSKDDAIWGEIYVEWDKRLLHELNDKPALTQVPKESVFVSVVRGVNLTKYEQEPLEQAMLTISTENLEGTTMMGIKTKDEANDDDVIPWNQEIRFIGVDRSDNKLDLVVFGEENLPVSVGSCVLNQEEEGVCIVKMHEISKPDEDRGEILLGYRRLHSHHQPRKFIAKKDSFSQGDEEYEEQEVSEEQEEPDDVEDKQPMEIEREDDFERDGELYDELPDEAYANSRLYESPVDDLNQFRGEEDDNYEMNFDDENGDELDENYLRNESKLSGKGKSSSLQSLNRYKSPSGPHSMRSPSASERDLHKTPSESRVAVLPSAVEHDLHKSPSGPHSMRSPSAAERDLHKSPSESRVVKVLPSAVEGDLHKSPSEPRSTRRSPSAAERDLHKSPSESRVVKVLPSAVEGDLHKSPSEPRSTRRSPSAAERDLHKSPSESRVAKVLPSAVEGDLHKSPSEPRSTRRSPSAAERDLHKSPSEPRSTRRSLSVSSKGGNKSDLPVHPQKAWSQPAEDKSIQQREATSTLHNERAHARKPAEEPVYLPPPTPPLSNVFSDHARVSKSSASSSRRRQSTDNGGSSRKSQAYIQPWFPAGNAESQQHVPYERSTLSMKNKESIRELERRRSRLEEESVRRGTSPRVTGTLALPEESKDDL
ncbi:unnamed protein product [Phytomonas sp. Hart1]|nr:unnamed protein product [Phytomonas sp. Hart1]|eukprot:CCW67847.1 unnamed protein product [Phytomonas sp. isolate Hart1]